MHAMYNVSSSLQNLYWGLDNFNYMYLANLCTYLLSIFSLTCTWHSSLSELYFPVFSFVSWYFVQITQTNKQKKNSKINSNFSHKRLSTKYICILFITCKCNLLIIKTCKCNYQWRVKQLFPVHVGYI